jgi:phage terminase Nu1 subunit (DNA packaging protein)
VARELSTEFLTDRIGLAYVLNCTHNHVNKLASRGMPRRARGQYDIRECVQWMLADVTTRAGMDPEQVEDVVRARTELYVEQKLKTRVDRRRAEGELVPAAEVQDAMLRVVAVLVGAFEGLPLRAAGELVNVATGPEVVAILMGHCHEYRDELARVLATLGQNIPAAQQADDASPDPKRSGLGGPRALPAPGKPATRTLAN